MRRRLPLIVAALALVAATALAGCMDRAPEPAEENASDGETALEESSTREQFEGGDGDAGDDGPASALPDVAPGTILGGLVGSVLVLARRAR